MELVLSVCLWCLSIAISCPLIIVASQCFIACLPTRRQLRGQRRPVAVLIPAHNEAAVIASTLDNILPQLQPGDRLVVVADNCSDATAQIARDKAVEVVERTNDVDRGKGFALDAGVQYLSQNPPEIVMVLDADCTVTAQTVDELACQVIATGHPAQAIYLMQLPPRASADAAVSVFAFLVKNWVRPRAMARLGLPVLLTGSGMAFPWQVLRDAPLASGEIVEDLVLGLTLTQRGEGPRLCETAWVLSELPNDPKAAVTQRTRWEHGYLNTILNYVPTLLVQSVKRSRPSLLLVAFDLIVPPLSLLVMLAILGTVTLGFLSIGMKHYAPLVVCVMVMSYFAVGIGTAWLVFGRRFVPLVRVVQIPLYVLKKVGLYLNFLIRRQTEWVRTDRQ